MKTPFTRGLNPGGYDLDLFMMRLLSHLVYNKYVVDPDTHQIVQNVHDAQDTYYNERLSGKTVTEAMEIANEVLFRNIGLSQYDVVTEILMDEFRNTVDLDSDNAMEYFTIRALTEIEDLFDGFDTTLIGIDPLELDEKRPKVAAKLINFMNDNGIQ